MKKMVVVAGIVAAAGAVAIWAAGRFASDEELFTQECEKVITERLKAPATYRRASVTFPACRKATQDEFLGWDNPEKKQSDIERVRKDTQFAALVKSNTEMFKAWDHFRVSALIEYDAQNSFGVPLRSVAECVQIVASCTYKTGQFPSLRVDGWTSFDWAFRLLR